MATGTPRTKRWHPRLIEAARALDAGRVEAAEAILKPHLNDHPLDVGAIRMLAKIEARTGRLGESETLLRRALEIAPDFTAARANLAVVVGRLGRPAEALELIDELSAAEPEATGHLSLKAEMLGRLGAFDEAIGLYEQVIERAPRQPRVWLSYGHLLKTVGRLDEGIAAYRKAIEIKPSLGEAWWSLANLKTFRFSDDDVAAMTAALAEPGLRDDDRSHLDFALGQAFHDAGRFDQAFAHYSAGNALHRSHHPTRPGDISRTVDRSIEAFTREALSAPGGCEAPDPIFIVGMPRSGSTLIEQILSSHSQIEGTSELPDLPAVAQAGGGYRLSKARMSAAERKAAGEEYLRRTAIQRRSRRPLFVDKLPNNWVYTPFIHLVLPNARIIDARRHPLGCCLSNFRQHFARGQNFTYDLADLGNHYRDYVRLMAHVDRALPGRVHRVFYERLVEDTEGEVRALLDYVGVEFEPACLAFHETDRPVRTPSSEQVRKPIYSDATREWEAYAPYLGKLREALGPVLDAYPDVPAAWEQRPSNGR